MSHVSFGGNAEEAFRKIKDYIAQKDPLKSYGSDKITWHDAQRKALLKGPGFEAEIVVQALSEAAADVHFHFKPSLFLRPLASRIEGMVLQHIRDALK